VLVHAGGYAAFFMLGQIHNFRSYLAKITA
jgi:hypothetical protein